MRVVTLLVLAIPLLFGCGKDEEIEDAESWVDAATFLSAPDGDTLKVRTSRHGNIIVRLAAIDCPEHGQAYWREARAYVVDSASRENMVVSCYKLDKFKRHVCRVTIGSEDLGANLIRYGLAWHYKRFDVEQTGNERELYARLENEARNYRLELWKNKNPMKPEDCRKARRSKQVCY